MTQALFAADNSLKLRSWQAAVCVLIFAGGLLTVAMLRYLSVHASEPPAVASYASLLYIGLAVAAVIIMSRTQVPIPRLGFALPIALWKTIALGLLGVALLQFAGWALDPLWDRWFGGGRDLQRFSGVAGSQSELVKLLVLSWTFAAIGEELTFRILLMRAVAYALNDSRGAFIIALVVQAIVFGFVHAYQGPAGIGGTFVSGLIYGGLTLAARFSIWPAVIAHGLSNTIGILELYAGQ